jgi:biopolymer transport protein ExbB
MTKKFLKIMFAAALLAAAVTALHAAGEETAAEGSGHGKSWYDLFQTTGIVGKMLLGCSMIGTGLLIQYLVTITKSRLSNPQLLMDVESLLANGNIDEATQMAETDHSYAGKILHGALARSSGGFEEVRQGLEEAAAVESFRLNAKISLLSLIGNIGPLLGLLGTVTGMISSFQVIETMKAPTPAHLAKGVYESLVNTTIGLFIAIVFLSAYFFMKNKLSDLTLRINNQISDLIHRTIGMESTEGSKS